MKKFSASVLLVGAVGVSGALNALERPRLPFELDPIGGEVGGGFSGTFGPRYTAAYYSAMIPLTLPDLMERCEEDNLGNEEAVGRYEWLKANHPGLLVAYYNKVFGDNGESEAQKLEEIALEWFYIRGDTSRHKAKKQYMTFGTANYQNPLKWYAPRSASAPNAGFPDGYITLGICSASCYTPDQNILFAEGEVPIGDALKNFLPEKNKHDIITISDESTRENVGLQARKVKHYTMSATETNHQIRIIQTAGGGQLKVTLNHPLLRNDGTMVVASALSVGDKLIKADGDEDAIISIDQQDYFGRVYNVQPQAESNEGQIVIAQGFLSGSSWYQNDGSDYVNRLILRRNAPAHVFE